MFSALQCRLDCDAGYVSQRPPIISCVDGRYEPYRPSTFICQPAAVLVITEKGNVEIFSDKPECQSKVVEKFSHFTGVGRTLSLLDDQILLVGGDPSATKFTYVSIQNPRRGLHAMKYSIEKFPLGGSPHNHASFVSGNRLLVVGGAHRTKGKFEDFTWNSLNLRKPDGTKFTSIASSPCSVKIGRDIYLVLGGEQKTRYGIVASDLVFKVNITSEEVESLPPMRTKRMKHACEKLSTNSVLVTGGEKSPTGALTDDEIYYWRKPASQKDRLYDLYVPRLKRKKRNSIPIPEGKSLKRYQHKLVRIKENIFALGGLTEQNKGSQIVMKYEDGCIEEGAIECWSKLENELKFNDVANLAVTSFPESAIDCGIDCQCGIEYSKKRISGGTESEVSNRKTFPCEPSEVQYTLFHQTIRFTASCLSMDCGDDYGQEQRCFIC